MLARSRALRAHDGDAETFYCEAIAHLADTSVRTELARADLLYGEWLLRRQKRRNDARAQLRTACGMFDAMGAAAFADRTRAELLAAGDSPRQPAERPGPDLTPQEAQVSRLAAAGAATPPSAPETPASPVKPISRKVMMSPHNPPAAATGALARLEPVRFVRTGELEVGYFEAGPDDGEVVLLLHGFPYDIHSYVFVIPLLAAAGRRVIVPYLRGHGPTRFLDAAAPRSGQQAAIGADVIALLDALGIPRTVFPGYDWGGRAACVAAALWPQRCTGVIPVNGYLIQDIRTAMTPISPDREAGLRYFFYFLTERGRTGLTANRREIAKVIWARNSPAWTFNDATLQRAAVAFDNPTTSTSCCTPTGTASDSRRVTIRTRRLSES